MSDMLHKKVSAKSILEKTDISIRDTRLIIAKIKNISYEKIVFYPEDLFLNDEEQSLFFNMLSRYKNHEPISKIINKKSFWKHDFFVNSDVLDPRPETELIIESMLSKISKDEAIKFLDIGTGSGCILLSLLHEFKNAIGVGIDISEKAIKIAEHNKNVLNIDSAKFINISWNSLSEYSNEKFDVIISNPPYIKSHEIESLDENVKNYDPLISLDGGYDGLSAYKEISEIAQSILSKNGLIFFEVGYDQANEVKEILLNNGFTEPEIIKDFNDINRVLIARFQ